MKIFTAISAALLGFGMLASQPAAAQDTHNSRFLTVYSAPIIQLNNDGSGLVHEAGFRSHRGHGFRSRGFRGRGFHRGFNRGFNRNFRGHRGGFNRGLHRKDGGKFHHRKFHHRKFHHRKFRRF